MALPPFQSFLEASRGDVHRFLVAAVGPHEADDCFQETFISALRAYPRLRDGSDLRRWVLAIAHRKAIDAHRARRRRPLPIEEPAHASSDPPAPSDAGPWELVRELPPKQRASLLLRFAADLSHREIGEVIGCSEAAARRNVHEGLKRLREVWPE